ncbi:hemolysin family protein [Microbacterium halotolerans]|uniref:hemolysin family protein n=1 Tax=Microbacterium halotolerans TaxID=246613 RepID=UPI000E6AB1B3|nr:hemolysin family protein [Microbacterium halotolerans]
MLSAVLLLLLGLVLIALIIVANGYFVAQEFAYMSVDRLTLRARAEKGDASARRALRVTDRTSFMLSGAQLGITVTGLLIGYVAEPFVGESLGILLGGTGIPTGAGIAVGTGAALVLATVAQMVFGELFPKNLAIANPTPLARALARSTLIYLAIFGWLITVFDRASNALLRLIRVEPVHDLDSSATAEDLERIVDDSRISGDLPEELSMLIERILDFPERDVEHAMIPRARADVLAPETTIRQAREEMSRAHTRYPVVEDEQPLGVLHLADVLRCDPDDERPVSEVMREPLVLPGLMTLPDALRQLVETRNELACVIDEFGGFEGVLTIEDLAEELVGEITDEHDPDDVATVEMLSDSRWRIDGSVHVDELERMLGRSVPDGDFETVAGLLIAVNGGLPESGAVVEVPLPETGSDVVEDAALVRILRAEVVELERHVPSSIVIELCESGREPAPDDADETEAGS